MPNGDEIAGGANSKTRLLLRSQADVELRLSGVFAAKCTMFRHMLSSNILAVELNSTAYMTGYPRERDGIARYAMRITARRLLADRGEEFVEIFARQ